MRQTWATVTRVIAQAEGVQRLAVRDSSGEPFEHPAVCYVALTGSCAAGDRVLVNTTGVDLGLGTGSLHFVVARATAGGEPAADAVSAPSGGHVMKLRYTPMQLDVLSVEEPASPHASTMRCATDARGLPVVCCALHSQIVHAAAAVKRADPRARVAYVMTDGASLPLALSQLVRDCASAGLLDVTITAGQAFGGELEAVNLHSGLLAARHVAHADVALVAIGPGVVGTATPFGHGGVAQGEAVNAAACVRAEPVVAVRMSFADPRPRHTPVSHHTLTALSRVALAPARVALPALPPEQASAVERALTCAGVWDRHTAEATSVTSQELPDTCGVTVSTMGRSPADDPAFFAAAAAAGEVAARLARA